MEGIVEENFKQPITSPSFKDDELISLVNDPTACDFSKILPLDVCIYSWLSINIIARAVLSKLTQILNL